MGRTAILAVRIIGDATGGVVAVERMETAADRMERRMRLAGAAVALVFSSLLAGSIQVADVASDMQQATGAVESVFGQYSDSVKQFSDDSAQAVGLAKDQYQSLASLLGSQLKNMGISLDSVAPKTDELIKLGADLSATYGGTAADAVAALSSLLRGERDPIERYGVSIKQADIEARKASLGLQDLTGDAAKNADLQATLAILMDQTSSAAGQFAREADTASGAQQRANAAWRDAQAQLGESLLPLVSEGATLLSDFATWVGQNNELVLILAVSLGVLATAVGVLTAAQWAFNVAAAANPVGLVVLVVILAIAALIAIILLIIKYWKDIEQFGIEAWTNIQQVIVDASQPVEDFINHLIDVINLLARITSGEFALDALGANVNYTAQLSKVDFGFSAAPKPVGNTYVTNNNTTVQGAVDVDGTARTISGLMASYSQSAGNTSIGTPR